MMAASGCAARVSASELPTIPGVLTLLDQHGVVPNSAERNLFALADHVDWGRTPLAMRFLMADPQTSGGLLLSVGQDIAAALVGECEKKGVRAVIVGQVLSGPPGTILITD
jgi:selenide,water dikinase